MTNEIIELPCRKMTITYPLMNLVKLTGGEHNNLSINYIRSVLNCTNNNIQSNLSCNDLLQYSGLAFTELVDLFLSGKLNTPKDLAKLTYSCAISQREGSKWEEITSHDHNLVFSKKTPISKLLQLGEPVKILEELTLAVNGVVEDLNFLEQKFIPAYLQLRVKEVSEKGSGAFINLHRSPITAGICAFLAGEEDLAFRWLSHSLHYPSPFKYLVTNKEYTSSQVADKLRSFIPYSTKDTSKRTSGDIAKRISESCIPERGSLDDEFWSEVCLKIVS